MRRRRFVAMRPKPEAIKGSAAGIGTGVNVQVPAA
jgi:hypothetical protein